MSWQQFELLVGEAFRLQGYQVGETGGGGADGGVDLVLRKGSEKFLVKCKQWKAQTVGVTIVRELYGVMAAKGAAGGFVITSGRFTEDAKSFASGRNLNLVDGPKLLEWIKKAKSSVASSAPRPGAAAPAASTSNTSPPCPVCAKPMVQRTAKRGNSAGAAFWGCSSYPACRGTRPIH
jgi:restriction system protein